MRIGFYGGSFDPFHNGHRELLEAAWESGRFDKIIVMPVGTPPHKSSRISLATYRYEMARLGCESFSFVDLRDDEIRLDGVDFTLHTIRYLKDVLVREGRKIKIELIAGSDILTSIESWYRPEELLAEAALFVARRGRDDAAAMEAAAERLRMTMNAKIRFFEMPALEISSSDIRLRMKLNLPFRALLPPAVAAFIDQNRIYGFRDALASLPDETWARLLELERAIWPLLPQRRRIHSANVMLYAVRLAGKHGLDPSQAAIAGLVHDCAKHLPLQTQRKYAKRAGNLGSLNDDVVHGPAGSYYARTKLGITDRDVLAAIFYHTTSRGLMTKLDQVVYLADKIEYGRPFRDLEQIRQTAETDLDRATALCIQEVYKAMARNKKPVHPLTRAARRTLRHFSDEKKGKNE